MQPGVATLWGRVRLTFFISICCITLQAQDEITELTIQLPKSKKNTYEVLDMISELSGYLFMYDSKTINNNRTVKISAGAYTLKEAIVRATGDDMIQAKLFGKHILLYKKTEEPSPDKTESTPLPPSPSYIMLEGIVKERESGESEIGRAHV